MREFVIDGQQMLTLDQMYNHLSELIWFPDYFGYNLDALYDVLSEVPDYTIIHFKNTNVFLEEMKKDAFKLIRVFRMLEQHTENYTVHFYPNEMNEK